MLVFSLTSQFAHDARSQKPKAYKIRYCPNRSAIEGPFIYLLTHQKGITYPAVTVLCLNSSHQTSDFNHTTVRRPSLNSCCDCRILTNTTKSTNIFCKYPKYKISRNSVRRESRLSLQADSQTEWMSLKACFRKGCASRKKVIV